MTPLDELRGALRDAHYGCENSGARAHNTCAEHHAAIDAAVRKALEVAMDAAGTPTAAGRIRTLIRELFPGEVDK